MIWKNCSKFLCSLLIHVSTLCTPVSAFINSPKLPRAPFLITHEIIYFLKISQIISSLLKMFSSNNIHYHNSNFSSYLFYYLHLNCYRNFYFCQFFIMFLFFSGFYPRPSPYSALSPTQFQFHAFLLLQLTNYITSSEKKESLC